MNTFSQYLFFPLKNPSRRKFWKILRLDRSLHDRTVRNIPPYLLGRKIRIPLKFHSSKYFIRLESGKKEKIPAKFLPTISPPAAKNIYIPINKRATTPNVFIHSRWPVVDLVKNDEGQPCCCTPPSLGTAAGGARGKRR